MPQLPHIDDFDRLVDNIHDELVVKNIMLQLELDDQVLQTLAEHVAVNIDYAFDFKWSPKWVRKGEPHRWHEGKDSIVSHFAECLMCGAIFVEPTQDGALTAYRAHAITQHGSAAGPLPT